MKEIDSVQREAQKLLEEFATGKRAGGGLTALGRIIDDMNAKYDEWKAGLEVLSENGSSNGSDRGASMISQKSTPPSEFTNRRLLGAKLFGQLLPVSNFNQLLLTVAGTLRRSDGERFDALAPRVRGRKPYFSSNRGDLRKAEQVRGSKLFVETNLDSNSIVKRVCWPLLEVLGHKYSDLELDVSSAGNDEISI
jgi:hypothetical protein